MKCENLQFNLPLYFDDELTEDERAVLDEHLGLCPVCRQHLTEFRGLRNDLRAFNAPAFPADLLASVRNAVAVELQTTRIEPAKSLFRQNFREWLKFRFMPYAVGTVASVVLTISLLFSLLSTRNVLNEDLQFSSKRGNSDSSFVLMAANRNSQVDDSIITPAEYAAARIPVGSESPSVNPAGALVALTKSLMRGRMNEDEVVVVADVFSNGVARVSEVVEAPKNDKYLHAIENALQEDPNDAAFLPATFDNRSNVVRVVLKFQHVEVIEKISTPKKTKNR